MYTYYYSNTIHYNVILITIVILYIIMYTYYYSNTIHYNVYLLL